MGGFVTMRVPVVEFDRIDIDHVPLTEGLRAVEEGLSRASISHGVPIAPVDTIVVMKLLAGRTQDLADVEAIVDTLSAPVVSRFRHRRLHEFRLLSHAALDRLRQEFANRIRDVAATGVTPTQPPAPTPTRSGRHQERPRQLAPGMQLR